jgi:gas vesicle protein/GTPase SAR1 family protein
LPTAIEVIETALEATTAYHRPDLGTRLRHRHQQLLSPEVRVLVVGEFKQGKSQLINALLNAPVCPVDDDVATAVPTVVRYAATANAYLVSEPDPNADAELTGPPARTPVPIEQLADHVCEAANPGNRQRLSHAEVGVPRTILAGGLTLVDTPGVGGLGSAHGAITAATLPMADAVLLVSDASQEYTASELEFLRQATQVCPNVTCVLTKTDLYPEWQRIAELDRKRLASLSSETDLLTVSSTLRLHAIDTGDQELNAESGFPSLIGHLSKDILANAERLTRRSVAREVLLVTGHLAESMRAELAARRSGADAHELVTELERAEERAERLRTRAARWQQTLNDGVADLISDIEHDLRERMREIAREAEEELDELDPTTVAEQFGTWLHRRIASEASANFVWVAQRAKWLAGQVATHFAEEGQRALPELPRASVGIHLEAMRPFELPNTEGFGLGQRLITGMRGGYGGALMFGMLSTLGGLAMFNPVSIAAGVLLGGKTVRDERRRLLQRRQMEVKNAVRRHIDDVIFQVGKESRDVLRGIQRTLRDHFAGYAEELHRSVSESVSAARSAVRSGAEQGKQRILDLEAELERIVALERITRELDSPSEVRA